MNERRSMGHLFRLEDDLDLGVVHHRLMTSSGAAKFRARIREHRAGHEPRTMFANAYARIALHDMKIGVSELTYPPRCDTFEAASELLDLGADPEFVKTRAYVELKDSYRSVNNSALFARTLMLERLDDAESLRIVGLCCGVDLGVDMAVPEFYSTARDWFVRKGYTREKCVFGAARGDIDKRYNPMRLDCFDLAPLVPTD